MSKMTTIETLVKASIAQKTRAYNEQKSTKTRASFGLPVANVGYTFLSLSDENKLREQRLAGF
jgi:hypothetical protein